MALFTCTCCGIELTAPKFYKGKAYGSICHARITGKKSKKTKAIFVPAVRISLDTSGYLPVAMYQVEGIGQVKKTCPFTLRDLEMRSINLDDLLPMEALEVMNDAGVWCFKTIHYSLVDSALIYKNKIVRKF